MELSLLTPTDFFQSKNCRQREQTNLPARFLLKPFSIVKIDVFG
jgi:hypothetical protein